MEIKTMRAREIIFRHYGDTYTKQLKAVIKKKIESGDGFMARVWDSKLQRYIRAATSEVVNRQIMSSLRMKMKQHKKDYGRERLTLRDINRLRKEKMLLARQEAEHLQRKEDMYGNKHGDK